ncbi:MAG: HlyD family efflux transporter periplasmic adaptor subunit [Patescibacteria group bacterium]|jgi:RND family efflux transporter MFP subunit
MKKPTKKQWILIGSVAGILLIIGSIFAFSGGKTEAYTTDRVERGYLVQTVEASGSLQSVENLSLSFESSGLLKTFYVEEGDIVAQGTLLAALKAPDLEADYRRAEQAMRAATAQLNLKLAGVSNEALAVSLAQVNSSNAALTSAKVDYSNTILTTSAALDDASIRLNQARQNALDSGSTTDTALVNARENLVTSMKTAMTAIRSALTSADAILGIESTTVNDAFEGILSNMDDQALQNANESFVEARDGRDAIEDSIYALSATDSIETIEALEPAFESLLQEVELTLLYTRQALDATTLEAAGFSLTDLANLKASIDAARNSFEASSNAYAGQKQAYVNADFAAQTNEHTSEYAVLLAEQAYLNAQLDAETRVASAKAIVALREADLASATASYNQVKAQPRFVDLEPYYADIDRAQADVDASLARLQKSQIIAPITGKITYLSGDIGEQIMAGTKAVELQSATDRFKIVVDISESDITKVSVGDLASITFDAFGSGTVVGGTVSEISDSEKNLESVVYYEVTVVLGDDANSLDLRSGLSADVTIVTEEYNGVLNIPQRAVLERADKTKYVRVPEGDSYKEVDVTTGLRADGGLIEILSGLSEGETIILSTKK